MRRYVFSNQTIPTTIQRILVRADFPQLRRQTGVQRTFYGTPSPSPHQMGIYPTGTINWDAAMVITTAQRRSAAWAFCFRSHTHHHSSNTSSASADFAQAFPQVAFKPARDREFRHAAPLTSFTANFATPSARVWRGGDKALRPTAIYDIFDGVSRRLRALRHGAHASTAHERYHLRAAANTPAAAA